MVGLGNHPRTPQNSLHGALRGQQTLSLFYRDPWQDDALCAQVAPDLFYPERGESPRQAKQICATCPVRQECLAHALTHNEEHGIWGGTTPYERYRRNGGLPKPWRERPRDRCHNGHKLENPDTDNTHNCRQCHKDRYERYKARQRQGLVAPKKPRRRSA